MSSPATAFATVAIVKALLTEAEDYNGEFAPYAAVAVALRMGATSPDFGLRLADEIESLLSAQGQRIPSVEGSKRLATFSADLYEQVSQ